MSKTHKVTKKVLNDNWTDIVKRAEAGESLSAIAKRYKVTRQALAARLKKKATVRVKEPKLKVLILDIENAPLMSYHWGVWKQNIGAPMRVEGNRSYMMSIAMKWLDSDEIHYFESRTEDDSELLKNTLKFLDEADIVVAHNGKGFDMKKINAYAIINNLNPPSPYRQIDTLIEARKAFLFERNTLAHLADILSCSPKLTHAKFQGFELWKECMKGNEEAWQEMRTYNIQDIKTLEEVYLKMRPYIKSHPNVVTASGSSNPRCTACGSHKLKPNGFSVTNVSKFERFVCEKCGSFSRGRKNLLPKEDREVLLTSVANG
jgi:uncharacterized protein YprB with RNaseH-like and TPR domain